MHPASRYLKHLIDTSGEDAAIREFVELKFAKQNFPQEWVEEAKTLELNEHLRQLLKDNWSQLWAKVLQNVATRTAMNAMILLDLPPHYITKTLQLSGLYNLDTQQVELYRYFFFDSALIEPGEFEKILQFTPKELKPSILRAAYHHPAIEILYKLNLLPPVGAEELIEAALSLSYKKLLLEQDTLKPSDLLRVLGQLIKLKEAFNKTEAEAALIEVLGKLNIELTNVKDVSYSELKEEKG